MKLLGALAVMVSDEVPMNGWRSMQIAAFAVFAGTASAAAAGSPDAVSRASVAISITIPPHVAVASRLGSDDGNGAEDFCLGASGIPRYRIGILLPQQTPDSLLKAASGPEYSDVEAQLCGADRSLSLRDASMARGFATPPITLLVIPE